jgi:hypothetical protein
LIVSAAINAAMMFRSLRHFPPSGSVAKIGLGAVAAGEQDDDHARRHEFGDDVGDRRVAHVLEPDEQGSRDGRARLQHGDEADQHDDDHDLSRRATDCQVHGHRDPAGDVAGRAERDHRSDECDPAFAVARRLQREIRRGAEGDDDVDDQPQRVGEA